MRLELGPHGLLEQAGVVQRHRHQAPEAPKAPQIFKGKGLRRSSGQHQHSQRFAVVHQRGQQQGAVSGAHARGLVRILPVIVNFQRLPVSHDPAQSAAVHFTAHAQRLDHFAHLEPQLEVRVSRSQCGEIAPVAADLHPKLLTAQLERPLYQFTRFTLSHQFEFETLQRLELGQRGFGAALRPPAFLERPSDGLNWTQRLCRRQQWLCRVQLRSRLSAQLLTQTVELLELSLLVLELLLSLRECITLYVGLEPQGQQVSKSLKFQGTFVAGILLDAAFGRTIFKQRKPQKPQSFTRVLERQVPIIQRLSSRTHPGQQPRFAHTRAVQSTPVQAQPVQTRLEQNLSVGTPVPQAQQMRRPLQLERSRI